MSLPAPYYDRDGITIYHGDCLDILPELDLADAVMVTDPPYSSGGFNEAGKGDGSKGTMARTNKKIRGDTMSSEGFQEMMRQVIARARPLAAYVFTDWRMFGYARAAVELAGLRTRGMIVWDKGFGGMGARWKAQHGLVCWGTTIVSEMGAGLGNVLSYPRTGNKLHPTEKPEQLLESIVGNAEPGDIVDPFMGSGTTLVAARSCGRRAIGIEYEERYCEGAVRRLAQGGLDFG